MMQNRIKTIGIMGNSGCGKSTVCAYLKEKGAYIIDADSIAHRLMEVGEVCYNEIAAEFGKAILNEDSSINRAALAKIVFSDKTSLEKLNKISHKHIVDYIKNKRAEVINSKNNYSLVVIDAPLLTETGLDKICDTVWLIYADYEKRIERIIRRDGITRQQAEDRFKNQTSFEVLKKSADAIVDNSADNNSALIEQINKLLNA